MRTETLSVTLPADIAEMIRREVAEGGYSSSGEMIRDAVRVWQERREHLDEIRTSIDQAAADPVRINAGEVRRHFDRLTVEAEKKTA